MIKNYRLSRKAEQDVYNIVDYTAANFGLKQAKTYYDTLRYAFELLVSNPRLGRTADEVSTGLRRHINNKHIIFYFLRDEDILIVRVIHHSEDSENYNL